MLPLGGIPLMPVALPTFIFFTALAISSSTPSPFPAFFY